MPRYDLKDKVNGRVLFTGNYDNEKRAVEACIAAGTSLANADLTGFNLTNANLSRGVFSGAKMTDCRMDECLAHGADFSNADMSRTWMTKMEGRNMNITGWTTTPDMMRWMTWKSVT